MCLWMDECWVGGGEKRSTWVCKEWRQNWCWYFLQYFEDYKSETSILTFSREIKKHLYCTHLYYLGSLITSVLWKPVICSFFDCWPIQRISLQRAGRQQSLQPCASHTRPSSSHCRQQQTYAHMLPDAIKWWVHWRRHRRFCRKLQGFSFT